MRLLSFKRDGRPGIGAVKDGGIVDLTGQFRHSSLKRLIADNEVARAIDIAVGRDSDIALDQIRYRPPIIDPEKIICIGVNYGKRDAEYKDHEPPPRFPSVFMRTHESLVGHKEAVMRPPESEQLDYEGEIAIVIGKEGRRISEDLAESHIAGLTMINEGSIRDWLRHGKFNVTQGKNFENSGAVGPWLVTADEFAAYDDLRLTTRVNGELRQNDSTANLIFPFRYLISYLSTFMRLRPGDLISTGTPVGAGARFDPPKYLVPGDTVEVACGRIGTLVNPVVDERI